MLYVIYLTITQCKNLEKKIVVKNTNLIFVEEALNLSNERRKVSFDIKSFEKNEDKKNLIFEKNVSILALRLSKILTLLGEIRRKKEHELLVE